MGLILRSFRAQFSLENYQLTEWWKPLGGFCKGECDDLEKLQLMEIFFQIAICVEDIDYLLFEKYLFFN